MGCLDKIILKFPTRFWSARANWFLSLKNDAPWGVSFTNLEKAAPGSNLLVMWHYGELARSREMMSDAQVVSIALAELRAAFGNSVPAPIAQYVTRWANDPFSRGSYFYPKIGSIGNDISELAKSVNNRLYFAGEATNRDYFGTVHGAYSSGIREANTIIRQATI
jgi:monoamine oxidase